MLLFFSISHNFFGNYYYQVIRFARGIRRDDTAVPQLPLLVLALAGPPVHSRSGSNVPRETGRRRPDDAPHTHSSANFPQVLLVMKLLPAQKEIYYIYCCPIKRSFWSASKYAKINKKSARDSFFVPATYLINVECALRREFKKIYNKFKRKK